MNKELRFLYFSQSKLAHIGESRMEMDYKLVENEGLFQEYLEMGKFFTDLSPFPTHMHMVKIHVLYISLSPKKAWKYKWAIFHGNVLKQK